MDAGHEKIGAVIGRSPTARAAAGFAGLIFRIAIIAVVTSRSAGHESFRPKLFTRKKT